MNYHSLSFILFSAAALLIYYIVGRKRQKYVMFLANIVFFVLAGVKYLPFIAAAVIITYAAARIIEGIWAREEEQLAANTDLEETVHASAKRRAKAWLVSALILIVGMLAVCKYSTFTVKNINVILEKLSITQIGTFRMILPIGISFYTFMAVSYLLDVYWKRYEAERDFIAFAAYLAWFPHVVQGPIDRFDKFRAQIKEGVSFSYENLSRGAQLALWGFFKKLVIADRLALFVDSVYGDWQNCTGAILVLAIAVYSLQIYTDFSGCIDIVSGVSEMFGIKLSANFRHPYFSKTMPEFWKRWHITLCSWFRDYIYIPLGGNRCSRPRHLANIVIVWFITGVWHGAAWKYMAWGLYHAVLIILGVLLGPKLNSLSDRLKLNRTTFSWQLWQMARTYFLSSLGRVFFRADDLRSAWGILQNTVKGAALSEVFSSRLFTHGLDAANFVVAALAVIVLWIADMLEERMPLRDTIARQNVVFRWCLFYACIFCVLIFGVYGSGASNFIYGQF